MQRRPELVALLTGGDFAGAMNLALADDAQPVRARLRRQRDGLALVVAIGDLGGALSFEHVVTALSAFADRALDAAITDAIAARTPAAMPQGFVAIALGKQGSRELNYSSDIDPILLYDPKTLPLRPREDVAEAAVRVARHVVDLLQTRDGDGYVLRVDLRLRPSPEVTPIALPLTAAISHYESSALAWERAAFVRARAAAGDIALGQAFLGAIGPFIWRRSLDFGAVAELRAMSGRIRTHHRHGQRFGPGYDLKRGRGGIREIEFFVQIQQLIHGGRDPAVRTPDTLGAIAALATGARLDPDTAKTLADAYRLFRTIEHRLQMIDDRQTHSLPGGDALDGVAKLHGLQHGQALLALLQPHVEAVGRLYDGLDGAAPQAAISADGFHDRDALARRIAEWRSGTIRAVRSAPALAAMEALLPELITALGQAPAPQAALAAFDRLLIGVPSAINLFRLLGARPQLLHWLVAILSHAPTLAEALAQRPALFDRLIDATALAAVGSVTDLAAGMRKPGTIEDVLDHVRHSVGEHRFALGTQIVAGSADPLDVAAGYARVAEAALVTIADAVVANFQSAHGIVAGSELVVLALGRLGGAALTHASDLDLIYLFTGDYRAESDGLRPLGASHYYNRLAQRLTAALSAATSVGPLYAVDTRLRPSGAKGPLAISVDSFERYQSESAWTWEHMALTRARPVYGSAAARGDVAARIATILRRPRDYRRLQRDVVKMRHDIARNKPPAGPFDVKLASGGLVDLEFVVHFAQLARGIGLVPDLAAAIAIVHPELHAAHDLLTRLLVTVRLVTPSLAPPAVVTQPLVARACHAADWADLLAQLETARQNVRAAWTRIETGAA